MYRLLIVLILFLTACQELPVIEPVGDTPSVVPTPVPKLTPQTVVVAPKPTTPVVVVPPSKKFFRDTLSSGGKGPEMVRISAGSFRMGDIQGGGGSDEKPVHRVSVSAFAMGKFEVTFAEYDKFAEATNIEKPKDRGWGRGNRPVIYVSWNDAVAYAKWLSQQTGHTYRLPTEAEWEYVARAGTTTKYWWGNNIGKNRANCDGCGSQWDNKKTAPVGSFAANQFSIYDTVGNVWEWTVSEYNDKYQGSENLCKNSASQLVLRGGSWNYDARRSRSSSRDRFRPTFRFRNFGFRLARTN